MMMLRRTSCRKVWLIHDTRDTRLPDRMAEGSETNANTANAYAHHIVPTTLVTLTDNAVLKRANHGAPPDGVVASTVLAMRILWCAAADRFTGDLIRPSIAAQPPVSG